MIPNVSGEKEELFQRNKPSLKIFQETLLTGLLLILGAIELIWQLTVFALNPDAIYGIGGLVFLLVIIVPVTAGWLRERNMVLAAGVFVVGQFCILSFAALAHGQAGFITLTTLLSLFGAVLWGWPLAVFILFVQPTHAGERNRGSSLVRAVDQPLCRARTARPQI